MLNLKNNIMEFEIGNINKSINDIMRQIGYQPTYFSAYGRSPEGRQNEREFSIMRQLGRNDYPRFHLYIKEIPRQSDSSGQMKGKNYIFSLHLDQKKPSYGGSHKHSGEYDGDLVEGEAQRIQQLLNANN